VIYKENNINGNYSKGRTICPEGIVVHHTGDYSEKSICNTFTDPTSNKSAHVIIWKDGRRTIAVQDTLRAWHAGESVFNGRNNCNNFMLGVEFHGDTNKAPLTVDQLESFKEWAIPRMIRYRIHKDWITDHRTISPGRKVDINEKELKRILKMFL
jgi:N-acetyl-anhydromuramyl-L-alanine amidase AmpD